MLGIGPVTTFCPVGIPFILLTIICASKYYKNYLEGNDLVHSRWTILAVKRVFLLYFRFINIIFCDKQPTSFITNLYQSHAGLFDGNFTPF